MPWRMSRCVRMSLLYHMMIWRKYIWSADIDFVRFAIRKHVFVRISEYFDRLNPQNFRLRRVKK